MRRCRLTKSAAICSECERNPDKTRSFLTFHRSNVPEDKKVVGIALDGCKKKDEYINVLMIPPSFAFEFNKLPYADLRCYKVKRWVREQQAKNKKERR